jgi:uncharacterized protein CbrC (UPF0167 family)
MTTRDRGLSIGFVMSTLLEHTTPCQSWTDEYWLCHCEGFRVDTPDGHLGFVEEIVWSDDGAKPIALRVRSSFGRRGLVTVGIDDVVEVPQDGSSILVRAS